MEILARRPITELENIGIDIISSSKINIDTLKSVLVQLKFENTGLSELFLSHRLLQTSEDFKKIYDKIIINQKSALNFFSYLIILYRILCLTILN